MKHIDFVEYIKENGLKGKDDEQMTLHLIHNLSKEIMPRIVLENFPQNITQAKCFIRNAKMPSNIFALNCSKDICQERMDSLGESNKGYISSPILSQKIKEYHKLAAEMIPYLK